MNHGQGGLRWVRCSAWWTHGLKMARLAVRCSLVAWLTVKGGTCPWIGQVDGVLDKGTHGSRLGNVRNSGSKPAKENEVVGSVRIAAKSIVDRM